jgi:uncharacterized protein (DUF983 family)
MNNQPNILVSSLKFRCSKCGKGHLFVEPNPYNYKKMADMYDNCSECGATFKSNEPGFYWGSMYVSYAITVGLVLFNLIWIHFFFGWDMWALILPNVILIVLLAPINFRLSRSLWLALNMRYLNKTQ